MRLILVTSPISSISTYFFSLFLLPLHSFLLIFTTSPSLISPHFPHFPSIHFRLLSLTCTYYWFLFVYSPSLILFSNPSTSLIFPPLISLTSTLLFSSFPFTIFSLPHLHFPLLPLFPQFPPVISPDFPYIPSLNSSLLPLFPFPKFSFTFPHFFDLQFVYLPSLNIFLYPSTSLTLPSLISPTSLFFISLYYLFASPPSFFQTSAAVSISTYFSCLLLVPLP